MAPTIVAVFELIPKSFKHVCHNLNIKIKMPSAIKTARTTILFTSPLLMFLKVYFYKTVKSRKQKPKTLLQTP